MARQCDLLSSSADWLNYRVCHTPIFHWAAFPAASLSHHILLLCVNHKAIGPLAMAGGRFLTLVCTHPAYSGKEKKSRVKQLYMLMEFDASCISAVNLMKGFSYHNRIQM